MGNPQTEPGPTGEITMSAFHARYRRMSGVYGLGCGAGLPWRTNALECCRSNDDRHDLDPTDPARVDERHELVTVVASQGPIRRDRSPIYRDRTPIRVGPIFPVPARARSIATGTATDDSPGATLITVSDAGERRPSRRLEPTVLPPHAERTGDPNVSNRK